VPKEKAASAIAIMLTGPTPIIDGHGPPVGAGLPAMAAAQSTWR
jgi:hypothetical protein